MPDKMVIADIDPINCFLFKSLTGVVAGFLSTIPIIDE
jgi:hypothetical protein